MRTLGDRGRDEVLRKVKDEVGVIVGKEELVVDRWKRYFTGSVGLERNQRAGRWGVETEEIELKKWSES